MTTVSSVGCLPDRDQPAGGQRMGPEAGGRVRRRRVDGALSGREVHAQRGRARRPSGCRVHVARPGAVTVIEYAPGEAKLGTARDRACRGRGPLAQPAAFVVRLKTVPPRRRRARSPWRRRAARARRSPRPSASTRAWTRRARDRAHSATSSTSVAGYGSRKRCPVLCTVSALPKYSKWNGVGAALGHVADVAVVPEETARAAVPEAEHEAVGRREDVVRTTMSLVGPSEP